jgi:WD40 repeat protein
MYVLLVNIFLDNNEKVKSYAVGFFDGSVKLYNRSNEEIVKAAKAHEDQITALQFFKGDATDGYRVLSASKDETLKLWNFNKEEGTLSHFSSALEE